MWWEECAPADGHRDLDADRTANFEEGINWQRFAIFAAAAAATHGAGFARNVEH
jgi:hypothetical protein